VRRLDFAQAAAVGIAAATAALVAGGLLLSALGALDTLGWTLVALFAVVLAAVAVVHDPRRVVPTVLAVAAFGLVVGAVALSRASAIDHERNTRFTQLWMVERPARDRVEVGVRNEERERTSYWLRVYAPASLGRPPYVDLTIVLAPGQTWSRELALPRTARPERMNAELQRLGVTRSYRSAHVWTRPRD
jgi:hypothetical protein